MPLWRYWVCVGLAVGLVRTLSHNVHDAWMEPGPGQARTISQRPAIVCALAVTGLVLLDRDTVYVTYADQLFFWASVSYVAFYLTTQWHTELPVFNVIIGTLQVLATRLYTAAETPYNLVLVFMLACRAWSKLLTRGHTDEVERSLAFTCDALYLSLGIELAYTGSDELLIAVFGAAYIAACVVSHRMRGKTDVCIATPQE
jgi:hypothetical protein